MALLQALLFLPRDHEQTVLTASCVSPLYRLGLLHGDGVVLGACKYALTTAAKLRVTVVRDICSPPPVIMHIPASNPKVHFEAADMSVPAITAALSELVDCSFCCIEVDVTDEPSTDDQQRLSTSLAPLLQRVERLQISYLRYCTSWVAPAGLEHLELHSFVGDMDTLLSFVKQSCLKTLSITDSVTFTDETTAVACLPSTLQELRLDGCNCADAFVGNLPCAAGLHRLCVDECDQLSELDLGHMTELRSLSAARTALNGDGLRGLPLCAHLRYINLSACSELHDVNALGELQNLRELFIHETGATNAGIVGLGGCHALEKLNLGGCLSITSVNCLGTLRNLRELHLWMTRVRTEGITGLSGCLSLVEVVFDGCSRLSSVSALGGLPNLRFVSLSQTNVDTAGVRALEACPELETLDVRGTRIEKPPKLFMRHAVVEFFAQLP